jgi:hypothetical protein
MSYSLGRMYLTLSLGNFYLIFYDPIILIICIKHIRFLRKSAFLKKTLIIYEKIRLLEKKTDYIKGRLTHRLFFFCPLFVLQNQTRLTELQHRCCFTIIRATSIRNKKNSCYTLVKTPFY